MKKQRLCLLAIAVIVLAVSPTQATPVATVSTSATYQTIMDSDSDNSFDPMVPAQAHADASLDSGNAVMSEAWANIGTPVKAYCSGWGIDSVTPAPPPESEAVSAIANASNTAEWLISSDTLGLNTPVSVLIDVSFDGTLYVHRACSASASASLNIDGAGLYEGGGTASWYPSGTSMDSSGAWIGDFHSNALDTTDTIVFETLVGRTITITISLETQVLLEITSPFASEPWAEANFSDSGFYTFAGAEDPLNPGTMLDVNFEMVPEPATLLLLGLGGLALLRRCRG